MLALRLNTKEAQKQVDPLLREFVQEMSLWVKTSMSMLIQVGHFLSLVIHRDRSLDKETTLLVRTGPFWLAFITHRDVIGFTLAKEQVSVICPPWAHWPRFVECTIDQLEPQYASIIFSQLTLVQHPVDSTIDASDREEVLGSPKGTKEEGIPEETYPPNDNPNDIQKAMFNPLGNLTEFQFLFGIQAHMLKVVRTWWCGSVKSLAAIGNYAKAVLIILDSVIYSDDPPPRFINTLENPSLTIGLWHSIEGQEYVVGLDRCGHYFYKFV